MTSTRKLRFDEKWISRVVDAFNDKPDSQVNVLIFEGYAKHQTTHYVAMKAKVFSWMKNYSKIKFN